MQESETLRKDGGALSNKRPPRILVVDDDSRLRDLLRQFLTNNGFHVSVAENAEQMNLSWLRERFDAVVLDVMMPVKTAFRLQKRIRASNDTTPILMLTAKGEDIDRILGLELGADDHLPKPYNPRELLARLHAILRRREPVDPPGAPSKEDEVVRSATSLLIWVLANFLKAMKNFRLQPVNLRFSRHLHVIREFRFPATS